MTLAERPGEVSALLTNAFYSPAEVADLARLSTSTVLHYIHDGRLAAAKLSERTYRIPRKAVLLLLAPEEVRPTVVHRRPDVEPEP